MRDCVESCSAAKARRRNFDGTVLVRGDTMDLQIEELESMPAMGSMSAPGMSGLQRREAQRVELGMIDGAGSTW